jgi:arsenate reductase (thioredoxin)
VEKPLPGKDKDSRRSIPAGEGPSSPVPPREPGIDVSQKLPKPITDEVVEAADAVITMGCGDACPIFPGKRYEDWTLDDPSGLGVDAVRPIRDEIGQRVRGLLNSLGVPAGA